LALAGAIIQGRIPLPTTPALELGCGTGLVSVAVALTGGQVCATDRAPAALDLVRANAAANHVSARISTAVLDWSLPPRSTWPLILGADLLYQPEAGRQVAGFLRAALSDDGVALITDPDRSTARHFHYLAQEAGLAVELTRLPVPFVDGHGPVCDIAAPASGLSVTLFTLRRRPSLEPSAALITSAWR
jgi:2-polyprenyl-3-methyl-5-hydroxy-6-metoxy-1,4-benzoquinol methylase